MKPPPTWKADNALGVPAAADGGEFRVSVVFRIVLPSVYHYRRFRGKVKRKNEKNLFA